MSLKGYRTLIFNSVMVLVFIVRAAMPDADVPSDEEVGSILDQVIERLDFLITLAGNLILRFKTTTPVGKKV